jgi:hypothetical protein
MRYEIRREDRKEAIFDENGNRISDWFDWIDTNGLVKGESEYYRAGKDKKVAIFDVYGNKITDWFDWIYPHGLVKGECDYYIACKNKNCAVYHKNGQKVSKDFSMENVFSIEKMNFIDNFGIVEVRNRDRTVETIEFKLIY